MKKTWITQEEEKGPLKEYLNKLIGNTEDYYQIMSILMNDVDYHWAPMQLEKEDRRFHRFSCTTQNGDLEICFSYQDSLLKNLDILLYKKGNACNYHYAYTFREERVRHYLMEKTSVNFIENLDDKLVEEYFYQEDGRLAYGSVYEIRNGEKVKIEDYILNDQDDQFYIRDYRHDKICCVLSGSRGRENWYRFYCGYSVHPFVFNGSHRGTDFEPCAISKRRFTKDKKRVIKLQKRMES